MHPAYSYIVIKIGTAAQTCRPLPWRRSAGCNVANRGWASVFDTFWIKLPVRETLRLRGLRLWTHECMALADCGSEFKGWKLRVVFAVKRG